MIVEWVREMTARGVWGVMMKRLIRMSGKGTLVYRVASRFGRLVGWRWNLFLHVGNIALVLNRPLRWFDVARLGNEFLHLARSLLMSL